MGSDKVTDHAVLRWIERMGYFDVEKIRAEIYAETREALNAGASRFAINGVEYRFNGGYVVSVISKRAKPKALRWKK